MILRSVTTLCGSRWLAKMVPDDLNITLEQALEKSRNLRMNVKIIRLLSRLLKPGKLLKEWSDVGTHAAGVIIADRPLKELV